MPVSEDSSGVDEDADAFPEPNAAIETAEEYRKRKEAAAKARKRAKKKQAAGLDLSNIMEFAYPLGITATMEPVPERSHVFVMTDEDGDKTYASVVAFSEYVEPHIHSALLCADLCTAFRTFLHSGAQPLSTTTTGNVQLKGVKGSGGAGVQSSQQRTGQEDDDGRIRLVAALDVLQVRSVACGIVFSCRRIFVSPSARRVTERCWWCLQVLFTAEPLRKNPPEFKSLVRERLAELQAEAEAMDIADAQSAKVWESVAATVRIVPFH